MINKNALLTSVIIVGFVFAALFLYSKFGSPLPLSVTSVVTQKSDVFSVNGVGETVAKPDIAYVTAGVESQGSNVSQVQSEVNAKNAAIAEAMKRLGISEDDIKTANYSIYPTYDYTNGRQSITGYNARTSLRVKIRDIDRVNEVVDAATNAGANSVGGVTFDVDNREEAIREAREKAVADAKKKAEEAARVAGFSLGKLINYSENEYGAPGLYRAADIALPMAVGGGDTKLETGSMEIKLIVTLSYELK